MTAPQVVLPGYFDPVREAADWEAVLASADTLRTVILNPASGPGPERQEAYAALARRLRAAGVQVLGYVDTTYGRREPDVVESEVRMFREWYSVDGVFFDQVCSDVDGLDAYERHVRDARSLGCRSVVLNPGVYPHPAYSGLANVVVAFDGPCSAHEKVKVPAWARDLPASRFWHLVYDVAPDRVAEAGRRLDRSHVGGAVLTDGAGSNPWGRVPTWWRAARTAA